MTEYLGTAARCSMCDADLSARVVKRRVRRGPHLPGEGFYEKGVLMKPAHFVIDVQVEGSLNREHLPPMVRRAVRICHACVRNCRTASEALAVALVALDKLMDRGE